MIIKMLELSTAHMRKSSVKWIQGALEDEYFSPMVLYPKEGYGFWLHVSQEWEDNDFQILPYDLLAIAMYAKGLGAEWIMFDRDAPPIDGLPTYEW